MYVARVRCAVCVVRAPCAWGGGRVRASREVCARVVESVGGRRRRWACGADERVGVAVARGAWRGKGARCVRAVWWVARA